mgnify:FL=1|jgi:hypothetical protein|tara:strand:- start:219 stop:626 length:408 start_codon:yes stop_codon:yes gene_type:complete
MSLHSTALQTAIYTLLSGDSTLDGLVGNNRIYDEVPQNSAYPYVVIGEETTIDASTKDKDAQEFTQTIHIWSRYRGSKQTKEIAQRIYTLLHNVAISVSGASFVNSRNEFFTILLDDDGLTRHGVMRFRVVIFDS